MRRDEMAAVWPPTAAVAAQAGHALRWWQACYTRGLRRPMCNGAPQSARLPLTVDND